MGREESKLMLLPLVVREELIIQMTLSEKKRLVGIQALGWSVTLVF